MSELPAKNQALAEFSDQQLRDELAARGAEWRRQKLPYSGQLKHATGVIISGHAAGLGLDGIVAKIKAESSFPVKSDPTPSWWSHVSIQRETKIWERSTVRAALRSLGLAVPTTQPTPEMRKARYTEALSLQESGLTIRQIADRIGVSRSRTGQLIAQAKRERDRLRGGGAT